MSKPTFFICNKRRECKYGTVKKCRKANKRIDMDLGHAGKHVAPGSCPQEVCNVPGSAHGICVPYVRGRHGGKK